jgi:hypothetical protein
MRSMLYEQITPQKNAVTTGKIQLFRREEKPLAGAMQSHQKNDTRGHFRKQTVTPLHYIDMV